LFSSDIFSSVLSLAVKTHPLWKTACRTRSLYVAKSRAPFDGGGSRSVSRSHLASMAVPGPFPTPFGFHGCHGLPLPSEQEYLTDTQIHIRRLPQRMHSAVAPWAWLKLMGSYMAIWSICPTSLCKQAAFGWGRRLMQDLDRSVF